MGLAALNELRDFKGGVWFQKKKKENVKKCHFFTTPFICLEPYPPLKSLSSFKAARPIEAMIGVSKAS